MNLTLFYALAIIGVILGVVLLALLFFAFVFWLVTRPEMSNLGIGSRRKRRKIRKPSQKENDLSG